jgi:hypothetical protein
MPFRTWGFCGGPPTANADLWGFCGDARGLKGAPADRACGLPPGTRRSRPDGGSLPQRGAPADPSVPGHVNAFEAPPCAPGAALHHHSAPARRPSADRTTHSNEKRLLSISKSHSHCRFGTPRAARMSLL